MKHPDYNNKTNLNDIGLLILKDKVSLNPYIKLACLPQEKSNNYPSTFTNAWVAGWVNTLNSQLNDSK